MGRMLQEARLFAAINDPHIIRYNHSWVEINNSQELISSTRKTTASTEQTVELDSPFIEFAETSEKRASSSEDSEEDKEDKLIKIILYIQMELCSETLEDYIDRRTVPLTKSEYNKSLNIAGQIIDGIYKIHTEYKIIHRDLSLRNIFIAKDGIIKIGDFGLATRRNNFIPVSPSPYITHLPDPLPEVDEEDFKLNESSPNNSQSDESGSGSDSDSHELTSGIGTKTFSAPEQMTGIKYDQKADIYSLGLVLLILFWPTHTLSERYEIIRNCRKFGPSKEFSSKYPEIASLIKRMVDVNPALRPTIVDLKNMKIFRVKDKSEVNDWQALCRNKRKCMMKTGEGKLKFKYVKILKDRLFIYCNKSDKKAKLYYPLEESKIITIDTVSVRKKSHIRNQSLHNFDKESASMNYSYKIVVEHPQLETLHIFFQEEAL